MQSMSLIVVLYVVYYIVFPLGFILLLREIWKKKRYILDLISFWNKRKENQTRGIEKQVSSLKKLRVLLVVFLLIMVPAVNFTYYGLHDIMIDRDRIPLGGFGQSEIDNPVLRQIGPTSNTDAVLEEMGYLFELDLDDYDLEEGLIPSQLGDRFEEEGHELEDDATLIERDGRWSIVFKRPITERVTLEKLETELTLEQLRFEDEELYDIFVSMDDIKNLNNAETHYEVTFIVRNEDGERIENAMVELNLLEDEEVKYSGETTENGTLILPEILEGVYNYTVTAEGYEISQNTITVEGEDKYTIDEDGDVYRVILEHRKWFVEDIRDQLDFEGLTRIPGRLAVYQLRRRRTREEHIVITYTYFSPLPITRVFGFYITGGEAYLWEETTLVYPMNPSGVDPIGPF